MYLAYPQKFFITIVCNFSWDACNTQEKFGYGKFWGGGKGKGALLSKY